MIAAYYGKSFNSRVIAWRTWSPVTHVSWVDPYGFGNWEAWRRGVQCNADLDVDHTPGTRVDIYAVTGETQRVQDKVREFLQAERGKPYDMRGALGFATRRDLAQRQGAWFCSELVFAAYEYAGLPLLCRIEPHRVYPGLIVYSPLLQRCVTVRTGAMHAYRVFPRGAAMASAEGLDDIPEPGADATPRFCPVAGAEPGGVPTYGRRGIPAFAPKDGHSAGRSADGVHGACTESRKTVRDEGETDVFGALALAGRTA